jgi:hypothetical protein
MTYREKKRVFRITIAAIVLAIACYKIGYRFGVRDATQEVSDELLEYCESKIDERAYEICGQ